MKKLLRLISVATMLLAATSFMACSSDDDDDSGARSASEHARGAIVGVVLDNRGEPVEGATVTLGNKTASTNHGGEFILENVDVNDPTVKAVQTTVSTSGTLVPATSTNVSTGTGATATYAYTLTVTKNDYISALIKGVYVTSAENIGGIEDARLSALKDQYATILNSYAAAVGSSSALTSTGDVIGATLKDTEDKSATMTTVANALKEIQKLYSELGTTYSSTWAEGTLIPLNASLSGKLKLNPSPATAEVYNETTYPAPKDTVVTVTYKASKTSAPYTFKSKTDAEGNFKFEKLPSGVDLSIEVEGFTAKAGDVEAYFSTDGGLNAYRANFEEILNNGAYYNDATTVVKTITIDGNSLNVSGVDIMLFAQLEKIWVKETNLIKNNSAALISVKTPLEFTFNKAIQRVALDGSGFQDVTDENYVVTIDSTDAKKVTITPNDGIWTPKAGTNNKPAAGAVKLSVLAADGTKELVNSEFTAYFDTTIYIAITESSKKDKLLSLTDPVVLTFSKPMRTAAVVAKDGSTELTSDYTKVWSEDKTTLTLTPKKYWDPVTSADAEVTFTVTGVAEDETSTIKYWKTNSDNGTSYTGLKVYFDNVIDVTLAKVNDAKFTATFSKALKEIPALDLNKAAYFIIKYYATPSATSGTDVTSKVKLSLADKVLTVEPKNSEFEDYGYYEVTLGASVVGATGETQFRELGKATASTTKAFKADFALGAEFKETTVEIVTTLPATAVASRALYADAASYVKITFTKDIAKSALKLADTVTNYIDGKSVYLPLAKNNDESDVEITGTVTAKSGETKTWDSTSTTTPKVLTTGYKVSKNTYKMVASSLYTHKASIAGGTNDATVQKIKPTDSITFTFDQDVTAATWTAELYDKYNVNQKDLEQTLYKVTATAAGKVVTVALAEGSKALVNDEFYYLSLKAVTGAGDAEIVRYDSNAFAVYKADGTTIDPTNYGYVDNGTSATVGTKIIKTPSTTPATTKKYIEINTEAVDAKYDNLYVVKAGKNSATTDFKDFAKSISSSIVLEFNEDVTGFTAVLANTLPTSGWETKDDVVLSNTYASTATVSGKIITIAPTYAFPSGSTVYPIVYNAEGKRVALVDVAKAAFLSSTATDKKQYVSKEFDPTKPVELDKVIQGAVASTAYDLALTPITTAKIANGQNLTFTFKPFLTQTGSTASYGTYTLYRKVKDAVNSAEQWKEAGKYKINPSATETEWAAIDYVKENKAAGEKATVEDFTILKRTACISVKIGDGEFNYGDTSNYKLVGVNDNVMIVSAQKDITSTEVVITSSTNYPTGLNKPNDTNSESNLVTGSENLTFIITTTAYLDESKTSASASITGVPAPTANRINKAGKLTYKVNGKNLEVTVDKDAVAAKNDRINITLTDMFGKVGSWTITLTD